MIARIVLLTFLIFACHAFVVRKDSSGQDTVDRASYVIVNTAHNFYPDQPGSQDGPPPPNPILIQKNMTGQDSVDRSSYIITNTVYNYFGFQPGDVLPYLNQIEASNSSAQVVSDEALVSSRLVSGDELALAELA